MVPACNTYVGICVTDTYLLFKYHKLINTSETAVLEHSAMKDSSQQFRGILVNQLIWFTSKVGTGHASRFLPEDDEPFIVRALWEETASTLTISIRITAEKNVLHSSTDANVMLHYLVIKITPRYQSASCASKKESDMMLDNFALSMERALACARDCFNEHIKRIKRITRQSKRNGILP